MQTDLNLHCLLMSEGIFSDVVVHMYSKPTFLFFLFFCVGFQRQVSPCGSFRIVSQRKGEERQKR